MRKLKIYLRINSLFSLITGISMAMFSDKLFHFFSIEMNDNQHLFEIIGLNLIIFSIFVWYVSSKHLNNRKWVNLISFLDILWVIGSFAIVIFQLFNLSNGGYVLIAMVALWIAFLAYMQLKYNKI